VYAGAGVLFARATDELVELAELLSLPVATTLNGKSAFPESHPLSLGIGGFPRALYGAQHATEFAKRADLVLTLGAGFKEHAAKGEFPGAFTHIQVDVDPYESHKMRRADIAIVGDAKLVLRQMIEAAQAILPASRLEPRPEGCEEIARGRAAWDELCRPLVTSNERPINPFRVTAEINQLTDSRDTIVLHDAGSTRGSTCQHIESSTPRSFVGQGTQSAMGWSLGAAIGAKLAAPEKLVITFTGDEAFGETAMELETAARNNIPILVLLNNNSGVPGDGSSLRHVSMKEEYAVGGDYTGLARALGTEAMRIEDPNELRSGLERAIETVRGGRPMVVELVTKRVPTTLYPLEVAVDV
jgi:thiamine pyrophosphate-dependent acetolactate synthase large subunit-like protein